MRHSQTWLGSVSLLAILLFALPFAAQTETAALSGRITDPANLVIAGADVALVNLDTNTVLQTRSNNSGIYAFPDVRPGRYRLTVKHAGFSDFAENGLVFEVQDVISHDVSLKVGGTPEVINVHEDLKTHESGAGVSTVIDREFIADMPLNGRSFTSLITLAAGVVLTRTSATEQGQFSVNGQRPDANYFTIDGVSANTGIGLGQVLGQSGTGQLPALSVFGTAGNLVPLDALQEFRVQTSSYSAEFGRTPGGQISIQTRSGTNTFHGSLFEYFRNDVLDANDWFADQFGLTKPALRQNDFGGVLGGPLIKDKVFFFFAYEGQRVRQPRVANTEVPSQSVRQNTPAPLQTLINAFPAPTSMLCENVACPPGESGFAAGYSDPSTLNSVSLRLDYAPRRNLTFFGRVFYAPSELVQRGAGGTNAFSTLEDFNAGTQGLTMGSTQVLTRNITNEVRFNITRAQGSSFLSFDPFAGAVVPPTSDYLPPFVSNADSLFILQIQDSLHGLRLAVGQNADNTQHQFNLVDNVSVNVGRHLLRFGADYRRLSPGYGPSPYMLGYFFGSLAPAIPGSVTSGIADTATVNSRQSGLQLRLSNWSLFVSDSWKATNKLTITPGLRWEYNSAPTETHGLAPAAIVGLPGPSTLQLASPGTPLWKAGHGNIAPRLGIAYNLAEKIVLRAGAGVFYDLGYADIASTLAGFPYVGLATFSSVPFPLTPAQLAPPPISTIPPAQQLTTADPHHLLPRTYEWSTFLERELVKDSLLSVGYVGSAGRGLLRQNRYLNPNPDFHTLEVQSNAASSSYNALQAQFRQNLSHGLRILTSYTWSHSIDNVSGDGTSSILRPDQHSTRLDWASSDYDLRHSMTAAVSYDLPGFKQSPSAQKILGAWSLDAFVTARSATPVNVVTGTDGFNIGRSGQSSAVRPNVVPGMPFYVDMPSAPGGRVINSAAFVDPPPGLQGDLGRNALRGFGAWQIDMAVRRQFPLKDQLALSFRADFFNILNHPNFANPSGVLSDPSFGFSTQMLASGLGAGGQSGGLNPIYQVGGPRSVQIALKLVF